MKSAFCCENKTITYFKDQIELYYLLTLLLKAVLHPGYSGWLGLCTNIPEGSCVKPLFRWKMRAHTPVSLTQIFKSYYNEEVLIYSCNKEVKIIAPSSLFLHSLLCLCLTGFPMNPLGFYPALGLMTTCGRAHLCSGFDSLHLNTNPPLHNKYLL